MAVDGSLYHTEVVNEHGLVGESFVRGNEGLALGVSSSLIDSPGTNPEQFIGFALSTYVLTQRLAWLNVSIISSPTQSFIPQLTDLKTRRATSLLFVAKFSSMN